jgi:WD40 repeat protein
LHAQGGLGKVSLARDEKLKRPVALKEIRPEKREDAYQRQRFLTEAEITGQLEHPGVVPIYDLDQDADGQVRYAMRFIQGRTLSEAIAAHHRQPTPLRFRELLQRFVSVCQTVAYAHDQGVIHRDLKPANVILGSYGETLVVDWGLARRLAGPAADPALPEVGATAEATDDDQRLTQAGQILGTPAYMAPEQAAGDVAGTGAPADIHSLGAILYELLTGQPPYQGKKVAEVLAAARQGRCPRPTSVRRGVPRALEAVCLKALARDIPHRYATAAELAGDVERWLADEAVPACREPVTARLRRWLRRHPALTAGVGALLLTGVIALAVSTVFIGRAQQETFEALKKEEKAQEQTFEAFKKEEKSRTVADAERHRAEGALRETRRLSANLALDRGLTLCDQGEPGTGLLWFVRGLELAPADEGPLRAVLRANLAAWRGRVSALHARLEHRGSINAAALSRDGRTLVTGTSQGEAWLWDVAAGRQRGEPLEHPGPVRAVALSPDGKTALTGCAGDGDLRLWDVKTGRVVRVAAHAAQITAVAFRRDGKALASGSGDRTARLWDFTTGEPISAPLRHDAPVTAVAFRPDGKFLLTAAADGTLRRWDAVTGEPAGPVLRHSAMILAAAWSPDGKAILVGDASNQAQLWDAVAGRPAGPPLPRTGFIHAVAFSPDGRAMATAGEDAVAQLWDVASGRPVGLPVHHPSAVRALAFASDGKRLLTGCDDWSVRLWGPAADRPVESVADLDPSVQALAKVGGAIRPDGRVVAFASLRGPIQLAEVATGRALGPVQQGGGPVVGLAFSPDGKRILVGGQASGARLFDADLWQPAGPPLKPAGLVNAVAFAAGGRLLLTADIRLEMADPTGRGKASMHRIGAAHVWDAATGAPVGPPLKHPAPLEALAGTPDGKTVLTGSLDGTARLWDATTGKLLHQLRHDGPAFSVACSPDGRRLATGSTTAARVWDAATGQPLTPPLRHAGGVSAVAFSPDGSRLLTASWDKTARLWDVATGKRIGPPLEHGEKVYSAAFAPDGQTIVTVAGAKQMQTWHVPTRLDGGPERLALWTQVLSGMELDQDGGAHVLSAAAWQQRRQRLTALGGTPLP